MIGTASAPASSANLGPGFDVLALALEMRCVVTAEPADEWLVVSQGERADEAGAQLARTAALAVDRSDVPLHIAIESDIPSARGLGSSAALIVAVVAASIRSSGTEPIQEELYSLATEVEGHGDNVAAAVYGGLVAAADGTVRQLELAPSLHVVVAVPDHELPTTEARAALPDVVQLGLAARSVGRVVMLLEALRTGDPEAFTAARGDELHESHRGKLSPLSQDLMDAAVAAGALHAAWSGAGPSVIAFTDAATHQDVSSALADRLGDQGSVLSPAVAVDGWR